MKVPATKPYFSEEDIHYITERFQAILRGQSFLTMYKHCEEFESQFAAYIGTAFAVACNSGTSALELICRAIGVEGKEVIIPSNTFVATANAVLNAGGKVVFADCDDTMCLDAADVARRITSNTAAVIHVHIGGLVSRSILAIREMCRERNIHLLEDAAQAHGSALDRSRAGTFGTAAGFSFFSTKVMTTAEGGMVTTNNALLVEKMKSLREFGKVKTDIYINYYQAMGYNWRMPEVAALLGIRQLASLDMFIRRRQEVLKLYEEELRGVADIQMIRPEQGSCHNGFKCLVVLLRHDRAKVHKELEKREIQLSGYVYELPLHKQPVFPQANSLSLPKTEFLCARHIALPVFYGITDEQVRYVAKSLSEVLAAA